MPIHSAPLLVELGTEELPPMALPLLGEAFAERLAGALEEVGLLSPPAFDAGMPLPDGLPFILRALRAARPTRFISAGDRRYKQRSMPPVNRPPRPRALPALAELISPP